ncbi:MAG: hypothetical protein R2875_13325 [Desulfobacterales bacterium]
MGTFKEYDTYDGIGLAELIQKGDISPQELCEEAISRIEKINPRLGAVVFPMFDLAGNRRRAPAGRPVFRGAVSFKRPARRVRGRPHDRRMQGPDEFCP